MSSSRLCTANPTVLHADLGTFGALEGQLYGGPSATSKFVAGVQKANWFAHIPVLHSVNTGNPAFGAKRVAFKIGRNADYLMNSWLRAKIPRVFLKQTAVPSIRGDARIRWTRNLMHNLIEEVSIHFNDLCVATMDSQWLDINAAHRVTGSKKSAYDNMIANTAAFTAPKQIAATALPAAILGDGGLHSVILPFWYGEDSGLALPVTALPNNEIELVFNFRGLEDLLIVFAGTGAATPASFAQIYTVADDGTESTVPTLPTLLEVEVNGEMAVVHNDERLRMGDAPRDMLIRQVHIPGTSGVMQNSTLGASTNYRVNPSHSVIAQFWMAQNTTIRGEQSNYHVETNYTGADPIATSSFSYENSVRYTGTSDFFALTHPFIIAGMNGVVPNATVDGYMHMWSFSLDPWNSLEPAASVNFNKLNNVAYDIIMSAAAFQAGQGFQADGVTNIFNDAGVASAAPFVQKYNFIYRDIHYNIGRVANGSFGHPIL